MWEKLQAVSGILIIPAIILYLTGFICITGYYAQFGFITFDIINARFLIAGFNTLIPFSVCVWAAFQLDNLTSKVDFLTWSKRWQRYKFYAACIGFPYITATMLSAYFSLVDFRSEQDPATYAFVPVGRWDFMGRLIRVMAPTVPSDFRAIIGLFIYVMAILLAIIISIFAAFLIYSLCRYLREKKKSPSNLESAVPIQAEPIQSGQESSVASGPVEESRSFYKILIWSLADLIGVAAVIAVGIFAVSKNRSGLISASNLPSAKLDFDLLFSWCAVAIGSVVILIWNFSEGFSWQKLLKPANPFVLNSYVQLAVIPVLLSLFLFGAVIFPRLPFAIGGGQPRLVTLDLKAIERPFYDGPIYLIGESTQYFFIVQIEKTASKAFQINKDSVSVIRTMDRVEAKTLNNR